MRYLILILALIILAGCDFGTQANEDAPRTVPQQVQQTYQPPQSSVYQSSSSQQIYIPPSSSSQVTLGDICDKAWLLVYESGNFNNLNDFCYAYKSFLISNLSGITTSELNYCISREDCTGYTEPRQTVDNNRYTSCVESCKQQVLRSASGAALGRNTGAADAMCESSCKY